MMLIASMVFYYSVEGVVGSSSLALVIAVVWISTELAARHPSWGKPVISAGIVAAVGTLAATKLVTIGETGFHSAVLGVVAHRCELFHISGDCVFGRGSKGQTLLVERNPFSPAFFVSFFPTPLLVL